MARKDKPATLMGLPVYINGKRVSKAEFDAMTPADSGKFSFHSPQPASMRRRIVADAKRKVKASKTNEGLG